MLEKTPTDPTSAEADKVEELIDKLGSTLAELAGVPHSKQDRFLGGVQEALARWFYDVAFQARSGKPERLLYRMLDNAEELQNQLGSMLAAADIGGPDLLLNAGGKLQESLAHSEQDFGIAEIHDALSELVLAIKGVVHESPTRPKGALPGIRYPGLDALVFGLERAACQSGGKFTAHRKAGEKGSLIDALEKIRRFFSRREPSCAESLPQNGKHSIAAYERLLHAARGLRAN